MSTPTHTKKKLAFLLGGAFILGAGLSWLLVSATQRPAAATTGLTIINTTPGSVTAAERAEAERPRADKVQSDLVMVGEAGRRGRILTMAARMTAVPASGSLPGKVVMDENRTARLSAPVTGRVLKLLKEPGDSVKAGEVLAIIDTPELASVQADASKAEVEVKLKTSAEERLRELFGAGAVALKELQAAQAEAAEARTELERTRNRLRQLNGSSRNYSSYTLLSPIQGIVTERSVTVGQQVRAEESLNLFVISDLKHLNLIIDAPEADASMFALGQKIQVAPDPVKSATQSEGMAGGTSDPKPKQYEAVISRLGAAVDPATRRIQIRAVIDNPSGSLRPEMFVRIFGTQSSSAKAIELPVAALTARGSESAIFVERDPGTYQRVAVQVLAQHPEAAWVTPQAGSKIGEGAKVVIQGALLLDSEISSR